VTAVATVLGILGEAWRHRRPLAALLVAFATVALAVELVVAGLLAAGAAEGSSPHPFLVLLVVLCGLAGPFLAARSFRAGRAAGWRPTSALVRAAAVGTAVALPVASVLVLVWLTVHAF